jgi:hypothetical protein
MSIYEPSRLIRFSKDEVRQMSDKLMSDKLLKLLGVRVKPKRMATYEVLASLHGYANYQTMQASFIEKCAKQPRLSPEPTEELTGRSLSQEMIGESWADWDRKKKEHKKRLTSTLIAGSNSDVLKLLIEVLPQQVSDNDPALLERMEILLSFVVDLLLWLRDTSERVGRPQPKDLFDRSIRKLEFITDVAVADIVDDATWKNCPVGIRAKAARYLRSLTDFPVSYLSMPGAQAFVDDYQYMPLIKQDARNEHNMVLHQIERVFAAFTPLIK